MTLSRCAGLCARITHLFGAGDGPAADASGSRGARRAAGSSQYSRLRSDDEQDPPLDAGRRGHAVLLLGRRRRGRGGGRCRQGQPEEPDVRRLHGIEGWRTAYPEVLPAFPHRRPARGVPRESAAGIQERRAPGILRCARSRPRCPTSDMAACGVLRAAATSRRPRNDGAAGQPQGTRPLRGGTARSADGGDRAGTTMARGFLLAAATAAVLCVSSAATSADLAAGKAKATEICAACHGADGNSASADFPKLGGQHSRLSRQGAARLQVRPAQEPDHGRICPGACRGSRDIENLAAHYSTQTAVLSWKH